MLDNLVVVTVKHQGRGLKVGWSKGQYYSVLLVSGEVIQCQASDIESEARRIGLSQFTAETQLKLVNGLIKHFQSGVGPSSEPVIVKGPKAPIVSAKRTTEQAKEAPDSLGDASELRCQLEASKRREADLDKMLFALRRDLEEAEERLSRLRPLSITIADLEKELSVKSRLLEDAKARITHLEVVESGHKGNIQIWQEKYKSSQDSRAEEKQVHASTVAAYEDKVDRRERLLTRLSALIDGENIIAASLELLDEVEAEVLETDEFEE